MKSKKSLIGMNVAALGTVLLLSGCASDGPMSSMYWPYGEALQQPVGSANSLGGNSFNNGDFNDFPGSEIPAGSSMDSSFLPPEIIAAPAPIVIPQPVISQPAVSQPVGSTYRVQKGDTLSSIASQYGVSWKRLASHNGLANPNKIMIGDELAIPGGLSGTSSSTRSYSAPKKSTPTKSSASKSTSSKSSSRSIRPGSRYTIQRGDSLSSISARSGVSISELKAANALKNDSIVSGRSLTIPAHGTVKNTATRAVKPAVKAPSIPKPAPMAAVKTVTAAPAVKQAVKPVLAPVAGISEVVMPVVKAASAPVYEHVLYPGETIEDVARQYSSTQEEILMLNGVSDVSGIKPGSKLLVPMPE